MASNVVKASTTTISATAWGTGKQSIAVEWSPSQDYCFDHYQVQYKANGAAMWQDGDRVAAASNISSNLTGLAEGTAYDLRVLDYDCWASAPSATVTATTFRFDPRLTASPSAALGAPGSMLSFTLHLVNYGNVADTLALSIGAPPAGWDFQFSRSSVTLGVNASDDITLNILLPTAFAGTRSWLAQVQVASSDGTSTAFATVNASLAMADLFLAPTDITFNPDNPREGDNVSVSATIWNAGNAAAMGAVVQMRVGAVVQNTTIDVPSGGSAVASFWFMAAAGAQVVTIAIDPDGLIAEFVETDNTAQRTLDPVATFPDFSISPSDIAVSSDTPIEGESVFVNATVHNIGDRAATGVAVRMAVGSFVTSVAVDLPVGGSAVASFMFVAAAGPQVIAVTADPDGLIAERSENNNIATHNLAGARTFPDLSL